MGDPGLFVGQRVDEFRRLGSFLLERWWRWWEREKNKKKGEINGVEGAGVELDVTTRWWCNTEEKGISNLSSPSCCSEFGGTANSVKNW